VESFLVYLKMANNYSTGGTSVQIAYFNNNKLIIDVNKCDTILEKVGHHPLSIVSVNGPMRSGKSYILGHFIRYLSVYANRDEDWFTTKLGNEFHWQNSAERQTTGIHMWSEPFFIERDGKKVAVLLMDTQGCFDDKSTTQENSLIFALSSLLSSVLIYNVSKQLSEEILQFLQMFVGYAKMTEGSEQSQSFSKLVFLIRDWQFPRDFEFGYHDEATSSGQKNFKKEKLNVKRSMVHEVRIAREEIMSSFTNIGCCLMPYPGNELAYYDDIEKLDPLFIKTIKDFVPRIFDAANIITKKFGGYEIDGDHLKKYIEQLANYYEKCEIPEVKSVNESTAEVQNQIALSISLKFYRGEMDTVMNNSEGLPDEKLAEIHKKNKDEAAKIFNRMKRLKHDELQRRYSGYLEDGIEQTFTSYQQINLTRRKFQDLKVQSEEDKKRFKEEMEIEIQAIKKATSGVGFGTAFSKALGAGFGGLGAIGVTLIETLATGDFKRSFESGGKACVEIMKNFGWE
jgi:atlastin